MEWDDFDLDRRQSSGRKFGGKSYHALRQSNHGSSTKFIRLVILHNLNFATQKKVSILKLFTKLDYFFPGKKRVVFRSELDAKAIKSRSSPFKLPDASAFCPSLDCKKFGPNFQSRSVSIENLSLFSFIPNLSGK